MKKILLERYIKLFLNEAMSYSDHEKINNAMNMLDSKLRQKTINGKVIGLKNFDINYLSLVRLRDNESIAASKSITRPVSHHLGGFKSSAAEADIDDSKPVGLGFNPFDVLKSRKAFYVDKFRKAIDYYEEEIKSNSKHSDQYNEFLDIILKVWHLSACLDELGIEVVGAGIFRVALKIPGIDDLVVKLSLSGKARNDNIKEIEFSTGKGAANVTYRSNFPRVYIYSSENNSGIPDGVWMAIEKAIMLLSLKDHPEIMKDIKAQFSSTFKIFEKSGLTSLAKESDLFINYIGFMFDFNENRITRAHIDELNKKYPEFKDLVHKIKQMLSGKKLRDRDQISYIDVSNDFFKKRLYEFLLIMYNEVIKHTPGDQMKQVIDVIEVASAKELSIISQELNSLFDQAVTTNISDTHIGNFGFMKNDKNKWELVYTDIDSQ